MSDNCPTCGNLRGELRDEASKREASLSGMCQSCQDDFFGMTASIWDDEERFGEHDRPRCGTCNHLTGTWGQCLDDEGHPVDCDCADDGRSKLSKTAKGCSCTCEAGGDCSCGKKCGKSCKCHCTRKKKSSTNDLPAWVREAQLDWDDEKQGEVT